MQIEGRSLGLFIYTIGQVTSGQELRYSYNISSSTGQTSWSPSPPGFCARPEIYKFLADVKLKSIEQLSDDSVSSCLQLILKKIPGCYIVIPWNVCENLRKLGKAATLSQMRNLLWLFTVHFYLILLR